MAQSHHLRDLDVLFVSEQPVWPLDQGFRIRGANMALATAAQGAHVGVASITPLPPDAPAALRALSIDWPATTSADITQLCAGWAGHGAGLRHRLAERQGLRVDTIAGVVGLVRQTRARVVVGLGPHAPAMLRALRGLTGVTTVWYAADEQVHFNLSCMRREPWRTLPLRMRRTLVYALFENLFARGLDGAVGVSPRDAQLLRSVAGAKRSITIRNGVDTTFHRPVDIAVQPRSLAFWGRLDFEPNIDAVCWFARRVWPALRARYRDAVWRIIGLNPDARVMALDRAPGIEVIGPVKDVRPYACAAAVTVLPMRCGGGIKNKLLEAAAMARPIVASPRAVAGLDLPAESRTLHICRRTDAWESRIAHLWDQPTQAAQLGADARRWIETQHTWSAAAERMLAFTSALCGEAIVPKSPLHIADITTGARRAA